MRDDNSMVPSSELKASTYLFKRMDEDIKAVHSQMAFLEIASKFQHWALN